MPGVLDIVIGVLLAGGSVFYLIGAIGLVRMPDVFTRMHAASVMETLGVGLLMLAMAIAGGWSLDTVKILIILGILLYTGPVATHALAHAALTAGVEPILAEDRTKKGEKQAAPRKAATSKSAPRKATSKKGGGSSKR